MIRYTPLLSRTIRNAHSDSLFSISQSVRSASGKASGAINHRPAPQRLLRISDKFTGYAKSKVLRIRLCLGAGVGALISTLLHRDCVSCDNSHGSPLGPALHKAKEIMHTMVVPWVSEHGLSGVLGFFSGLAVKKLGKWVASVIGICVLGAQVCMKMCWSFLQIYAVC